MKTETASPKLTELEAKWYPALEDVDLDIILRYRDVSGIQIHNYPVAQMLQCQMIRELQALRKSMEKRK